MVVKSFKNVPVGKWTYQLWHEAAGYLDEVNHDGADVKWRRGRIKLEIKPGKNDFGVIRLAASAFEE